MSDYDELNSENDDYDPAMDDESDNTFRIRDPLQAPSAHPWSTATLHGLIHQGRIDLNPPYQRDVVWPEIKQIGLIDSIFRNFYIPPIIFAVEKDEDGEELRVCVDGKQRLTSISKFMDGQIPHRDPVTKKKYWYTRSDTHSKSRLELPEAYKKQFQNKQITCVEYTGLIPGTERDIFQRVQLGMSLTAAEKLQAISSPLAQWVSQLQGMYANADGGLADKLKWDTSRGNATFPTANRTSHTILIKVEIFNAWRNSVSVVCFQRFIQGRSVGKVEKWLTTSEKPTAKFKNQVSSVLQSFLYLASEDEYSQAFSEIDKRVAPVEFVFIGILLAKMRNCSWEDRAKQVHALRGHTREAYRDVRSNERVMKTMWTFVEKVRTDVADPYEGWEGPGAEVDPPQKKKTVRKRKRKDEEEVDDAFRPATRTPRTPRTPKTRAKVEKEPTSIGVRFVA